MCISPSCWHVWVPHAASAEQSQSLPTFPSSPRCQFAPLPGSLGESQSPRLNMSLSHALVFEVSCLIERLQQVTNGLSGRLGEKGLHIMGTSWEKLPEASCSPTPMNPQVLMENPHLPGDVRGRRCGV